MDAQIEAVQSAFKKYVSACVRKFGLDPVTEMRWTDVKNRMVENMRTQFLAKRQYWVLTERYVSVFEGNTDKLRRWSEQEPTSTADQGGAAAPAVKERQTPGRVAENTRSEI